MVECWAQFAGEKKEKIYRKKTHWIHAKICKLETHTKPI